MWMKTTPSKSKKVFNFMIPSKKKIDELKELVKRDFGVEWTDQEASDGAFNLLNFYDALGRFAMEDIQKYIDTGGEPSFAGPDYDKWLAEQAEIVKKIQADRKEVYKSKKRKG